MFRVAIKLARRLAGMERRLVSSQEQARLRSHSQPPLLLSMRQLERFATAIFAIKHEILEVMSTD
jgi:hypothetical protein